MHMYIELAKLALLAQCALDMMVFISYSDHISTVLFCYNRY